MTTTNMIKTTTKWKNVNSFEKNWDLSQKHDFHVPINKLNHVLLQVGLIWQSLAPGKPNTINRSNETKIAARWVEPLCAARKNKKTISDEYQTTIKIIVSNNRKRIWCLKKKSHVRSPRDFFFWDEKFVFNKSQF